MRKDGSGSDMQHSSHLCFSPFLIFAVYFRVLGAVELLFVLGILVRKLHQHFYLTVYSSGCLFLIPCLENTNHLKGIFNFLKFWVETVFFGGGCICLISSHVGFIYHNQLGTVLKMLIFLSVQMIHSLILAFATWVACDISLMVLCWWGTFFTPPLFLMFRSGVKPLWMLLLPTQ